MYSYSSDPSHLHCYGAAQSASVPNSPTTTISSRFDACSWRRSAPLNGGGDDGEELEQQEAVRSVTPGPDFLRHHHHPRTISMSDTSLLTPRSSRPRQNSASVVNCIAYFTSAIIRCCMQMIDYYDDDDDYCSCRMFAWLLVVCMTFDVSRRRVSVWTARQTANE